MKELKHTPGPWVVKHSESKPSFNVIGTVLARKYKIARCPYLINGTLKEPIESDKKESEANAKLIAAAPDLLEALQLLLQTNEALPNLKCSAEVKAHAAIRKALGENAMVPPSKTPEA